MRYTRRGILTAAGLLAVTACTAGTAGYAVAQAGPSAVCVQRGPSPTTIAGNFMLWNWRHGPCPGGTYAITLPAGPPGPAGPGTSYYRAAGTPAAMTPGMSGSAEVQCHAGDTAIGGGAQPAGFGNPSNVQITQSYPVPAPPGGLSGWTTGVSVTGTGSITFYAECAH